MFIRLLLFIISGAMLIDRFYYTFSSIYIWPLLNKNSPAIGYYNQYFYYILGALVFLWAILAPKRTATVKKQSEPLQDKPKQNFNDPTGELEDISLEFARGVIQSCWQMVQAIGQGDDEEINNYYGEDATDYYRKVVLRFGEEKAFILHLSQMESAIPSRLHETLRYLFFDSNFKGFDTLFYGNLGRQYKKALPLEAKSGDWGDAIPDVEDLTDNSRVLLGSNQKGEPIFHTGEGHLITIAPTGAGKGQCHVLPNLYDYNGAVFVLDIKGENERFTGLHRGLYGNRFTFAPYASESDHYNPLDFVNSWSDCREMADWLMVPSGTGQKDDYFQSRGKELLAAILFLVITEEPRKKQTMRRVCKIIWSGMEELKDAWDIMGNSKHDMLKESAQDMRSTFENAPKEFSGIINSTKSSLEIWREPEVVAVTGDTEDGWHPADLRNAPAIKESIVRQGGTNGMSAQKVEELKDKLGMSIFLNVPVGKVKQMASLLRVFIGQHIREIIKASADPKMGYGDDMAGLPTAPVMFMLDEFPQLGFMKVIEETLEIGRSYKIRLWLFAQDMGQLGRYYPNPKGIIANCAVQSFMNINDNDTAKYVSERLGMVRPIMGESRPLADLPTLMGEEFDNNFVCLKRNTAPLKLAKVYAYKTDRYQQYLESSSRTIEQIVAEIEAGGAEGIENEKTNKAAE